MTSQQDFPMAIEVTRVPPPTNNYPYFVLAHYPGTGWRIHRERFSDPYDESVVRLCARLRHRGWQHITVCKLPEIK